MEIKRNKKAYFNYHILDTYDAGIVLSGAEVKSVKEGLVNLEGSYVDIRNRRVWLKGVRIAPYPKSGNDQKHYRPDRERALLLTRKEIGKLAGAVGASGLTIVPLSVYSSRRLIKIKIALARGKRKFDKREAIKERELKRRIKTRLND